MAIEVKYKNKDISGEVSISSLIHEMCCEGQADYIDVVFNDIEQNWDGWDPQKGDTIEITDGKAKTGKMYIYDITFQSCQCRIKAMSMPQDCHDPHTKSWEEVKLKQLIDEIASNHDLTADLHNVEDQTYNWIKQVHESDLSLLQSICVDEGLAFLIYDGKLVVYSEADAEGQTVQQTSNKDYELKVTPAYRYEYQDTSANAYGSCTVTNDKVSGSFQAPNGEDKKVLDIVCPYTINDEAQANRTAKNRLRAANKNMIRMKLWTEYMARPITAGSVVNVETDGVKSLNGKAFVTKVRHDYVKNTSIIWMRKPLEGY